MSDNREKILMGDLNRLLEELTRLYQNLHDLLLRERKVLIDADLEELAQSNRTKETLLMRIKQVDQERENLAHKFAVAVKAPEPRLLSIAEKVSNKEDAKHLRVVHQSLTLLLTRVSEANKDNETYASSALKTVDGALSDLKDVLAGKSVYGKKKGKSELGLSAQATL